MILPTYLLLLSLTSLATSFTIPPNAQEGVYQVSLNEAGEEVHVPLTQVNIVPAPLIKTSKRGDCFGGDVSISCPGKVQYSYACGCGYVSTS